MQIGARQWTPYLEVTAHKESVVINASGANGPVKRHSSLVVRYNSMLWAQIRHVQLQDNIAHKQTKSISTEHIRPGLDRGAKCRLHTFSLVMVPLAISYVAIRCGRQLAIVDAHHRYDRLVGTGHATEPRTVN